MRINNYITDRYSLQKALLLYPIWSLNYKISNLAFSLLLSQRRMRVIAWRGRLGRTRILIILIHIRVLRVLAGTSLLLKLRVIHLALLDGQINNLRLVGQIVGVRDEPHGQIDAPRRLAAHQPLPILDIDHGDPLLRVHARRHEHGRQRRRRRRILGRHLRHSRGLGGRGRWPATSLARRRVTLLLAVAACQALGRQRWVVASWKGIQLASALPIKKIEGFYFLIENYLNHVLCFTQTPRRKFWTFYLLYLLKNNKILYFNKYNKF